MKDIITDKLRLMQVLLNIIGNAIKFTDGRYDMRLCFGAAMQKKDGYATVVFRVKDNGIRMSPEFQEHVFDSLHRNIPLQRMGSEEPVSEWRLPKISWI